MAAFQPGDGANDDMLSTIEEPSVVFQKTLEELEERDGVPRTRGVAFERVNSAYEVGESIECIVRKQDGFERLSPKCEFPQGKSRYDACDPLLTCTPAVRVCVPPLS